MTDNVFDGLPPEQEVYENEPLASPSSPNDGHVDDISNIVPIEDIIEFSVNPEESFEKFMGKRYGSLGYNVRVDIVQNQGVLYPSNEKFDEFAKQLSTFLERKSFKGIERLVKKSSSSPLERLNTLFAEVESLRRDVEVVGAIEPQQSSEFLLNGSINLLNRLTSIKDAMEISSETPGSSFTDENAIAFPSKSAVALAQIRSDIVAMKDTQKQLLELAKTFDSKIMSLESRLNDIL